MLFSDSCDSFNMSPNSPLTRDKHMKLKITLDGGFVCVQRYSTFFLICMNVYIIFFLILVLAIKWIMEERPYETEHVIHMFFTEPKAVELHSSHARTCSLSSEIFIFIFKSCPFW